MGNKNKKNWQNKPEVGERKGFPVKLVVAVVVIIAVAATAWWFVRREKKPGNADALVSFAQCLKEKGATMYGAYWCPHCQNQKKRFGDAFDEVNYVECTVEKRRCADAEIKGYPTWIFADNSRVEGEMELEQLAEKTACMLGTPEAASTAGPSVPSMRVLEPSPETVTSSAK